VRSVVRPGRPRGTIQPAPRISSGPSRWCHHALPEEAWPRATGGIATLSARVHTARAGRSLERTSPGAAEFRMALW